MIRFACAHCAATLSAPDHATGRNALCPHCGAQTEVPEAVAADGRMNWLAVSPDGRSEEVEVSVHERVPEKPADVQPPPIDYPGIVRRVLKPYARTERISFPDGVPGAPGVESPRACPQRPEEPVVAMFDCRRRETSRMCVLFTPTGLRVYKCTEAAAPAEFVPYAEFPAKRIAYGKRISEIMIGKEHAIDAWGTSVTAPSVLGVLKGIQAEVRDAQRARGEFIVPEWLREGQWQEDVCPQCGSDNTTIEGRHQEAPGMIMTAILLPLIPLTGTGVVVHTWGEPYHWCFDCGFVWGLGKQ